MEWQQSSQGPVPTLETALDWLLKFTNDSFAELQSWAAADGDVVARLARPPAGTTT